MEHQLPRSTRTWADKLIDFVVGEGPGTKYALICSQCYGHNGLVPPEEVSTKQFVCLYCHHWNKNRGTSEDLEMIPKLDLQSHEIGDSENLDSPCERKRSGSLPSLRHREFATNKAR